MHRIRGCTLGNGGHAAFASIMWSPPVLSNSKQNPQSSGDFYDCLKNVSCDVLLVFGKDDPWCKPSFAKNMLLALEERDETSPNRDNAHNHHYIEITNAGHCPNHEAPKAVGHLVKRWVHGGSREISLATTSPTMFVEEWGSMEVRQKERDGIEVSLLDKIVTKIL